MHVLRTCASANILAIVGSLVVFCLFTWMLSAVGLTPFGRTFEISADGYGVWQYVLLSCLLALTSVCWMLCLGHG